MLYNRVSGRVFDFDGSAGGLDGSKVDAGIVNAAGAAESFRHPASTNCDDGAAILLDTDTSVEGAVAIIGGAVNGNGAAIEVNIAVTIDAVSGGVDIDVAAGDDEDTGRIGVKGASSGTIHSGGVGSATSVNTIIGGHNTNFAGVDCNGLGFQTLVGLFDVDFATIDDEFAVGMNSVVGRRECEVTSCDTDVVVGVDGVIGRGNDEGAIVDEGAIDRFDAFGTGFDSEIAVLNQDETFIAIGFVSGFDGVGGCGEIICAAYNIDGIFATNGVIGGSDIVGAGVEFEVVLTDDTVLVMGGETKGTVALEGEVGFGINSTLDIFVVGCVVFAGVLDGIVANQFDDEVVGVVAGDGRAIGIFDGDIVKNKLNYVVAAGVDDDGAGREATGEVISTRSCDSIGIMFIEVYFVGGVTIPVDFEVAIIGGDGSGYFATARRGVIQI